MSNKKFILESWLWFGVLLVCFWICVGAFFVGLVLVLKLALFLLGVCIGFVFSAKRFK